MQQSGPNCALVLCTSPNVALLHEHIKKVVRLRDGLLPVTASSTVICGTCKDRTLIT